MCQFVPMTAFKFQLTSSQTSIEDDMGSQSKSLKTEDRETVFYGRSNLKRRRLGHSNAGRDNYSIVCCSMAYDNYATSVH